jgi:hypothetical protein
LTLASLGKRRIGRAGPRRSSLIIQGFAANPTSTANGVEVIAGTFLSFVPLLLGLFAVQPGAVEQTVTRLVIQDEVILRVPVEPHTLMPQIEWIEHKGPKCIPTAAIRGALLFSAAQVDFVLNNRARVRAELDEDCPALDFYGGFYLQPEDERLCAGRDAVHSRMGGSCTIQQFRQLVPRVKR